MNTLNPFRQPSLPEYDHLLGKDVWLVWKSTKEIKKVRLVRVTSKNIITYDHTDNTTFIDGTYEYSSTGRYAKIFEKEEDATNYLKGE